MKGSFLTFMIVYWLAAVSLLVFSFFNSYFSVFVMPFMIGVVFLLFFSIVKYWRWMHGFDKLQRGDGIDHSGVGDMHRHTVQPLGGIEQLSAAVGHGFEILGIHGDVILIDGNA